MLLANSVVTSGFATIANFRNILLQATPTLLVAIGMTLVIGSGGIDLSVGSTMALASAAAAINLDRGAGAAIGIGMGRGALVGLLNGTVTAIGGVPPIIVTLSTLIAGRGLAQVISQGGQLIAFNNPRFELLGRASIGHVPLQVAIAAVLTVIAIVVLRSTVFGRYLLAIGGNESAARLAGVNVLGAKTAAYCIAGFLAALAGLIETARLGASDVARVGLNVELDAISAVVIGGTMLRGGTATIVGTVAGTLVIQTIATSFNMLLIPFSWSLVFKAGVILTIVYLNRPRAP